MDLINPPLQKPEAEAETQSDTGMRYTCFHIEPAMQATPEMWEFQEGFYR